jgi:hypothetical protein
VSTKRVRGGAIVVATVTGGAIDDLKGRNKTEVAGQGR